MTNDARLLVTVTEILDTARFRGTYRGQAYEGRALPDTSYLTEGDAAFCHVLPNSELVAVFKPSTGVLFIAPGYTSKPWPGTFYRWNGTGSPELIWKTPDNMVVTAMAVVGSTLYIAVFDEDWEDNYLYKWAVVDAIAGNSPTLIGGYDNPDRLHYGDPCTQFAEFGGKLYLAHTCYWNGYSWATQFDPVTETFSIVVSNFDSNGGSGGLGVSGGKLWWSSGDFLYSSADGSTWTLEVSFNDPAYNWCLTAGFVTDPVNDDIYFGYAQYYGAYGEPTFSGIAKIASGALPVSVYEVVSDEDEGYEPNQLTITYSGSAPQYLVASRWYGAELLRMPIGGSVTPIVAEIELMNSVENQGMVAMNGKVYQLLNNSSNDSVDLYEVDPVAGTRTLTYVFASTWPFGIWKWGGCMAVAGSARKAHEM